MTPLLLSTPPHPLILTHCIFTYDLKTGMLQQLQVAVTALGDKSSQAAATAGVEQVTHKMSEIREIMEGNESTM